MNKRNFVFLGSTINNDKVFIVLCCSNSLVENNGIDCTKILKKATKYINGGAGGKKDYATGGGSYTSGFNDAMKEIKKEIFGI